jgi:type II secretory pathway predicted ATPase ExeA
VYEQHFGLTTAPFRITPDPGFFFAGGNRGAVLAALEYAIVRGEGITKVVGEVGSGKTMLCRMLERELPPECEIVYLANPRLGPHEVVHAVAFELGLAADAAAPRLEVLHALHEHLLAKHAQNRRVVMFVEEAQAVPIDTLEEMRLLSNLETTREKLLQIVLFGQPELDDKLALHELRQLRERITHTFELAPLSRADLRDYVTTRLRASGHRGPELFTPAALRELERHSRGLLRRINILADKALLAAFAANATRVETAHVWRAARDSTFAAPLRPAAWALPLAALVVVAGAVVWWLGRDGEIFPGQGSGTPPAADLSPPAVPAPPTMAPAAPLPEGDATAAPVAEPPAAAATEETAVHGADAFAPAWPTVSATTGLVGLEHLRPVRRSPAHGPE